MLLCSPAYFFLTFISLGLGSVVRLHTMEQILPDGDGNFRLGVGFMPNMSYQRCMSTLARRERYLRIWLKRHMKGPDNQTRIMHTTSLTRKIAGHARRRRKLIMFTKRLQRAGNQHIVSPLHFWHLYWQPLARGPSPHHDPQLPQSTGMSSASRLLAYALQL